MLGISEKALEKLREEYPPGTKVELIEMNDPYRKMEAGLKGTVKSVDDVGTIFVSWENGSGLGVAYGIDRIKKV